MLTPHHLKSFSVPLSIRPLTPAVTLSRVSTIHPASKNDAPEHCKNYNVAGFSLECECWIWLDADRWQWKWTSTWQLG